MWASRPDIVSSLESHLCVALFYHSGGRLRLHADWRDRPLRREAELSTNSLISVVDDDEGCRDAMASLVKSMGFTVETYRSAADFLASSSLPHTCCLIADVHMDGMSGVELHKHLMDSGYKIPTILITAFPDDRIRARALASGVVGYLSKTQADDGLVRCIRLALEQPQS